MVITFGESPGMVFIWIAVLFWIFTTNYDIPGQMKKNDAPLDILKKRFASGDITNDECQERNKS